MGKPTDYFTPRQSKVLDRVMYKPVELVPLLRRERKEECGGSEVACHHEYWTDTGLLEAAARSGYKLFYINGVAGAVETFPAHEVKRCVYEAAVNNAYVAHFAAVMETGATWKDRPSKMVSYYGENYGVSEIYDVVAVEANPSAGGVRIYEVKMSRGDFTSDNKWPHYMTRCDQFYFVCPPGLIKRNDLPREVGLIYAYGDDGRYVVNRGAR